MTCYIDGRACNCNPMLEDDQCYRDPFREGDGAEDIRHLEVINGFRIEDETSAVHG